MSEIKKGIKFLSSSDEVLSNIITSIKDKPRFVKKKNPFESLCRSIVYQQLATKAADTIYARFAALYGGKNPTPEQLIKTRSTSLRKCGLSRQKIEYLKDLAKHVIENKLEIHKLHKLSNEKILEELVNVKGIGVWTAQMFLIFNLGRLDIFPAGDLAIQNMMKKLYKLDEKIKTKELELFAERWKPYRTIVCWYLWRYKDSKTT